MYIGNKHAFKDRSRFAQQKGNYSRIDWMTYYATKKERPDSKYCENHNKFYPPIYDQCYICYTNKKAVEIT